MVGIEVLFDLDDAEEKTKHEIYKILIRVGNELINLIKEEAPVDTGRLRQSWQIMATDPTNLTVYLGTNVKYAKPVEFGADPHTPDWMSIKKWSRRKLENENLAGAIFSKIKKEGTEGQYVVESALRKLEARY